jgi:hypothetical protein
MRYLIKKVFLTFVCFIRYFYNILNYLFKSEFILKSLSLTIVKSYFKSKNNYLFYMY